MDNPLVSILIPNYNKGPFLSETLDSVLAQTYTNWECIIVDDHSTDNSWEILVTYAQRDFRIKIFRRPDNKKKGGNAARNFAIEKARGEYVNWFDSDDVMHPDMIAEKVSLFRKKPYLDFVIGDILQFESEVKSAQKIKGLDLSQTGISYPINYLRGNFWVASCCPMFKSTFLACQKNLFNENLKRNQEAEFFIRILLHSQNFLFTPKSISFWRRGIASKTEDFMQQSQQNRDASSLGFFKKILTMILATRQLDAAEREYFKWYFGLQLSTMKINSVAFLDLVQFGISQGIFSGYKYVVRVLVKRLLSKLSLTSDVQVYKGLK